MGFSGIGKCNHSHMVLLDTTLHVEAVTDESKLPWHKYLKGQLSKNSHPYKPPTLLSPALDNMLFATELMAGLYSVTFKKNEIWKLDWGWMDKPVSSGYGKKSNLSLYPTWGWIGERKYNSTYSSYSQLQMRWVVGFTPQPLHLRRKRLWNP